MNGIKSCSRIFSVHKWTDYNENVYKNNKKKKRK